MKYDSVIYKMRKIFFVISGAENLDWVESVSCITLKTLA